MLHTLDDLHGWEIPKASFECDVSSTADDHLVGYLTVERGHPGLCVVITGYLLHHLNVVQKCGKGLDHLRYAARVEDVDVFIQGREVLDIVFGLQLGLGLSLGSGT